MKQNKAKQIEQSVILALSQRRKELGYSYEKVAELANVHRTSVSLIERGKIQPTLVVCLKLAEALSLDLAEVIGTKQQKI